MHCQIKTQEHQLFFYYWNICQRLLCCVSSRLSSEVTEARAHTLRAGQARGLATSFLRTRTTLNFCYMNFCTWRPPVFHLHVSTMGPEWNQTSLLLSSHCQKKHLLFFNARVSLGLLYFGSGHPSTSTSSSLFSSSSLHILVLCFWYAREKAHKDRTIGHLPE